MNVCRRPFAAEHYELSNLRLDILQRDQAEAIVQQMVLADPWQTLGYSRPGLRDYLLRDDPGLHRFALESEGDLAGTLCVRYPWLLGPYLELVAILPSCQGRGLGREAMTWVEQEATTVSRNLWALVSVFNVQARRFYRLCGFVEVTELPDLVKRGYNEILLRKVLRRPH